MLWWMACGGDPAPPAPATPPPPAPGPEVDLDRVQRIRAALQERLGPAYDEPVPGLAEASPSRGQLVYDAHCADCHGPGGHGEGIDPARPWSFVDPAFRGSYSEAGRFSAIRDGLPGTVMPGFEGQLTEAELLDVLQFVQRLVDPEASL